MSFQMMEAAGVSLFQVKTIALIMFIVFGIIAVGYLVGKVSIKGVSLGSAAIFIVALVGGHFLQQGLDHIPAWTEAGGWDSVKPYFSMIQNLGLVLFVTSVGLIAGPTFFKNLVKNFKSYVLLGFAIILAGALSCALIIKLVPGMNSAMAVGLLSGALTSTPAFAAAQGALVDSPFYDQVAVGLGVAYPFGVIGVVLFVQIIPKLVHADMEKERALLDGASGVEKKAIRQDLFYMDKFGLGAMALTIMVGIILGGINIPLGQGQAFSLGTTGGPLIIGLIFGHFGHLGKLSMQVKKEVLSLCQELGLILFLTGAGVDGGRKFATTLSEFGFSLFVWGAVMTMIPLLLGYFIARYVLKMSLFNTLGSLTGGMTSTPALGALINCTGTSNVASAYAATYPIALIVVVLCSQLLTHL
ncbi:putative transport protein [Lachnospiraceae bacterium XBB1006]|nr:putative transport protein [Lachnospiraceae bacterium XBB1006]